jgi:ferredoxin
MTEPKTMSISKTLYYSLKPNKEIIMAVFITDTCINCGACEPECPNQAIYEPGAEWSMAEGTNLSGK